MLLSLGSPETNRRVTLGRIHSNIRMSKQEVVSEHGASNAGKGQNTKDGIRADFTTPSLQTNVLVRATDRHWLLDEVRLAADSTETDECVGHYMSFKMYSGVYE